jgi:hypothetical protein
MSVKELITGSGSLLTVSSRPVARLRRISIRVPASHIAVVRVVLIGNIIGSYAACIGVRGFMPAKREVRCEACGTVNRVPSYSISQNSELRQLPQAAAGKRDDQRDAPSL